MQRALLEGIFGQHADGEVGHRFLGNEGVDGKGKRRPGLSPHAFDPLGNHVPVPSDTDILFGFVIGDHTLYRDLAPGHVQTAPLVDYIHRQQCALLLGLSHRRKRSGERKQNADLYLVGVCRQGVTVTKNTDKHQDRK